MNDLNANSLNIEHEEDEAPRVEFDISVYPTDYTLALLAQQREDGDIVIPPYQRNYVWSIKQASRLIESFLMGLPVPQVFFYVTDDEKLEVIDGQQRILSVCYFFKGFFGEETDSVKPRVFKLTGLAEPYNGKRFADLAQKDQRKLKNATLRAINVKQLSPKEDNDSVFHIFERLNTGGTRLTPQEVRDAVYRGKIVDKLEEMNKEEAWRILIGNKKDDKHKKDVELLLRLFALFENWRDYKPPMVSFLNNAMARDREFSSEKAKKFEPKFKEVIDFLASTTIERPFHPRGPLSAAALDGIMIPLLEHSLPTKEEFIERYNRLIENGDFLSKEVTTSTTGQKSLVDRISLAKKVLIDGEE